MRFLLLITFWVISTAGASANPDSLQAFRAINLGDSLCAVEDYVGAYAAYERARPYIESRGSCYDQTYLYFWLGETHYYTGNFQAAIDITHRADSLSRSCGLADTLSFFPVILQNLGVFSSTLGHFDDMMHYYRAAFQESKRREKTDSERLADAYESLGVGYGRMEKWDSCIIYVDTAIAIARRIGYEEGLSTCYLNISYAYSVQQNYSKAIDYQLRALEELEQSQVIRANGLNNLGMYYLDYGDPQMALHHLEQARVLKAQLYPEGHPFRLVTDLNIALVHTEQEDYEAGIPMLQAILRKSKNDPENLDMYKLSLNYLATIYLEQGDFQRAESLCAELRSLNSQNFFEEWGGNYLLAHIRLRQDNLTAARSAIDTLLKQQLPAVAPASEIDYHETLLQDPGKSIDILSFRGIVLLESGKDRQDPQLIREALEHFELVDSVVILARQRMRDYTAQQEANSLSYFENYQAAVEACYQLFHLEQDSTYLERALNFAQRNKYLRVSDRMRANRLEQYAGVDPQIRSQERDLLQKINFYEDQLLYYRPYYEEPVVEEMKRKLADARQQRQVLLDKIEDQFPQYFKLVFQPEYYRLDAIRSQVLQPDELLLEFFLGGEYLYRWVYGEGVMEFDKKPLPDSLKEKIQHFRRSLREQHPEFYAQAQDLYDLLIGDIGRRFPRRNWLVIPDAYLGYIPFEALIAEPIAKRDFERHSRIAYVVKNHRVRYQFSLLIDGSEPSKSANRLQVLAFAPEFSADSLPRLAYSSVPLRQTVFGENELPQLVGAKAELAALRAAFRGAFFTGKEATEAEFKALASRYNMLHVATHTLINDQIPVDTKLLFAADQKEDGALHPYEIMGLPLTAELVVLSACNTGTGQLQRGEGINSLARAFAFAGAPNIVMSLWPVRDRTTAQIMAYYVQELASGATKPQALHRAKMNYILASDELLQHPYYWAGLLYTGDAEPLQLRRVGWPAWVWVLFGLIGLGVLIALYRRLAR